MYCTHTTAILEDSPNYPLVLTVREWISVEFPTMTIENEKIHLESHKVYICNYKLDKGNCAKFTFHFDNLNSPRIELQMMNRKFPTSLQGSIIWAELRLGEEESDWTRTYFIDLSQTPHKKTFVTTIAEGLTLIRSRMEQLKSK
jgi:hypothetical protein